MMQVRQFPTYDEIQGLERAARRAQAEEIHRLAALGVEGVKTRTAKFAATFLRALREPPAPATGRGSGNANASGTLLSVLENLAASLPENLRARYEAELMTAIRVAPAIDIGIATCEFTVRLLAGAIHVIAQGLRAGAWCLDVAARRLVPLH